MLLTEAAPIAEKLKTFIAPYCDKCEIAGSIRRKCEFVNDIELVIQPKPNQYNRLFNRLGIHLLQLNRDFRYIKNGERYKQFIFDGTKVDLFIAQPDNWGYLFAIRTGSADYSHNTLATGWVKKGYKGENGFLTMNGKPVAVREEIDLFNLIGVPYTPPELRRWKH